MRKYAFYATIMRMFAHNQHRLRWNLVIVLCMLLVPVMVHAQGGAFPIAGVHRTISSITLIVAQFLDVCTWFVFSFLTFLLDPYFLFDMTNGAPGSLMNVLNLIWQLSRNLMNVAFAVGLVGAAIYTVVTANKEFVSSNLKTFVMAVVFVNFSWFIPLVMIDIANVATVTIYSIPSAIVNSAAECRYTSTNVNGCFDSRPDNGMFSCACKAAADFKPFPDVATINAHSTPQAKNNGWECNVAYCIRFVQLDPTTSTKHGTVINGLVVNHARLSQLAVVTRVAVAGTTADMLLFILRELLVIVIHIALFFPLLALLIALIIRIPVMWLTMAFMPFYFLTWIIPEGIPFGSEIKGKAKMIWDVFIKAAFLPAVVAIPLTVGFIMANAGSRIDFAGMNGIPFNLIDGMGTFAQLLWVIMVLAILWTGTFGALEMMMAEMPGKGIIGSIKGTGEQIGKFAAELPLATVPIPGPSNLLNMANLMRPSNLRGALRAPGGLGKHFAGGGNTMIAANSAAGKIAKDKTLETNLAKAIDEFSKDEKKGFAGLQKALLDAGVANADTQHQTIGDMVRGINQSLKQSGNKEVIGDMTKFNAAIDKMRAANPPAQPPPPPPAAPNP